ncbi:MAG: hypothetical protein KatS3mg010_1254 [Acidimicrobiia bacterium]|nr:MAG: hypothetical protein KatS3mg010_1254 [Acidimicrobiia bacterium]
MVGPRWTGTASVWSLDQFTEPEFGMVGSIRTVIFEIPAVRSECRTLMRTRRIVEPGGIRSDTLSGRRRPTIATPVPAHDFLA